MADYEMEKDVYELNFESARLAREACEEATAKDPTKPRFVMGALGPTNRTGSISPVRLFVFGGSLWARAHRTGSITQAVEPTEYCRWECFGRCAAVCCLVRGIRSLLRGVSVTFAGKKVGDQRPFGLDRSSV